MRIQARAITGVGWLPCLPYDYSRMWGEPISQCNSISDQTPCIAGEGPLAAEGYCPATLPGYAGLGLGAADITGVIVGSNDAVPEPCGAGMVLYGGACIPQDSPVLRQIETSGVPAIAPLVAAWCSNGLIYDPADGSCNPAATIAAQPHDWTKTALIAGGVVLALTVLLMVRR